MSGFGAGFRKAREAKGISLDGVANETRIGVRFLRAIENEEFDTLPGGLFNRGFIRTYAERLGLDPDQAVEDYQRLIGDKESLEPETPTHRPARQGAPNWAIIAGVAAVLIGILAYVLFVLNDAPSQNAPANKGESRPVIPTPPPPATPPATPPVVETPATPPAEKPPEPTPAKAPLNVEMRITETTWIQVLTDGTSADVGEFQPGTTRNYTAQKSIAIKVGNAGGLSLKVNDREVSSIGKRGEVRQLTITPENASQLGN